MVLFVGFVGGMGMATLYVDMISNHTHMICSSLSLGILSTTTQIQPDTQHPTPVVPPLSNSMTKWQPPKMPTVSSLPNTLPYSVSVRNKPVKASKMISHTADVRNNVRR